MVFLSKPIGYVLNTRPYEDAIMLSQKLETLGYSCINDPLLSIQRHPKDTDAQDYSTVQACILTSRNAVFALTEYKIRLDTPMYAVGSATFNAIREAGFLNITQGESNAEALLPQIIKNLDPSLGKIIHFCGTDIRFDFTEYLISQGFDFNKKIVYSTFSSDALQPETVQLISARQVKMILFFSPKTARCFHDLALELKPYLKDITAVCLSSAIADELKFSFGRIIIASQPNEDALIKALNREYKNRRIG